MYSMASIYRKKTLNWQAIKIYIDISNRLFLLPVAKWHQTLENCALLNIYKVFSSFPNGHRFTYMRHMCIYSLENSKK